MIPKLCCEEPRALGKYLRYFLGVKSASPSDFTPIKKLYLIYFIYEDSAEASLKKKQNIFGLSGDKSENKSENQTRISHNLILDFQPPEL